MSLVNKIGRIGLPFLTALALGCSKNIPQYDGETSYGHTKIEKIDRRPFWNDITKVTISKDDTIFIMEKDSYEDTDLDYLIIVSQGRDITIHPKMVVYNEQSDSGKKEYKLKGFTGGLANRLESKFTDSIDTNYLGKDSRYMKMFIGSMEEAADSLNKKFN